MCGLFGVAQPNFLNNEEILRARYARDCLIHRGPDQQGELQKEGVYLGHRRLSIIDTSSAGKQPMTHGGISVTVNGEIYNFKDLRKKLISMGCIFKSNSDSEVLLHGYIKWGINKLVEQLEGMYAAVVVDWGKREIIAIRDRAGIKPLYYYYKKGVFIWASEIKAIKNYLPSNKLGYNASSMIDFLLYRYMPAPKTAYNDIYKLPQASILKYNFKFNKIRVYPYWKLNTLETKLSNIEIKHKILELIDKSVASQLISDVPIGLLLSGGIDSSTIAAFATRYINKIYSFSVGFNDPERDETQFAKIMSKYSGTNHQVHYLENYEMDNVLEKMENWFDEPYGDTSSVPTFNICKFARNKVTVALSGDGGDELFGGYVWYHRYRYLRNIQKAVPFSVPKLPIPYYFPRRNDIQLLSIKDPLWLYAKLRGGLSEERLNRWKIKLGVNRDYDPLWAYRAYYDSNLSPFKAAQVIDFHTYLPDDILTKVDRVSMAVSLECRPPFLSKELIELAFSLPEKFIYDQNILKGGLKNALGNILPPKILSHKKQGFSVPDFGWKKKLKRKYGSFQESIIFNFLNQKLE